MKPEKPTTGEDMAMLGRGFLRTFVIDVLLIVIGAAVGALIGLICVYVLGLSTSLVKLGALIGAAIPLVVRNPFKEVFKEFGAPPKK